MYKAMVAGYVDDRRGWLARWLARWLTGWLASWLAGQPPPPPAELPPAETRPGPQLPCAQTVAYPAYNES